MGSLRHVSDWLKVCQTITDRGRIEDWVIGDWVIDWVIEDWGLGIGDWGLKIAD